MTEKVLKANFVLFDAALWNDPLYNLEANFDVPSHTLAEDYFGDKDISPTLIDLNQLDDAVKLDVWEFLGSRFSTDDFNSSQLDQIGLFQNLIFSELDLDDFSDLMIDLMLLDDRQSLFRFYDSRVMMHHRAFRNTPLDLQPQIRRRFQQIQEHCSDWMISVCRGFYQVDLTDTNQIFDFANYDQIFEITEEIRSSLWRDWSKIPEDRIDEILSVPMQKVELFNDKLSSKYQKYLRNNAVE